MTNPPPLHVIQPVALAALLALSGPALSQSVPEPAPSASDNATPQLQSVVVMGSRLQGQLMDSPYAIGVVDAQELRSAGPLVNLSEALARVPGLVVSNRNNYAQDLQINSRGFGARSTFGVRGIRLYTDGIPASGPDGQGAVSAFDLASASRIEVLRGPFSSLFGSSSGGVIALVTEDPKIREFGVSQDLGENGLRQTRISVQAPLQGGWSISANASDFQTDGFRPQSAATKRLNNLRLGWADEQNRVVVHLSDLRQNALDPLGLTRQQFDANPSQTNSAATQYNTRKELSQTQLGASWQRELQAGNLKMMRLSAYTGSRSVTQWQAIPPASQIPASSAGGVIDFDRSYGGADARLQFDGQRWRATMGTSMDRQRDDRRGYENFAGSGASRVLGVTGNLRRNEINNATSSDMYAQGEYYLTDTWTLSGGLRSGRVRLESNDRYLTNGDDSGSVSYDYVTPVAALRWQPDSNLSVYVSAGQGYETPTLNEVSYRPNGQAGLNTSLRAQRSNQVEVGAKWRSDDGKLGLDAALFEARTSDEIGVLANNGGRSTFTNVGATRRQGLELQGQWRFAPNWKLGAAATWLNARYTDGFLTCSSTPCASANVPVAAGNKIAGTTPRTAFVELAWRATPKTTVALEARAQGPVYVDDLNTDKAAGFVTTALRLQHSVKFGSGELEFLGRIDNLGDRRVASTVIVNESNKRYFEPSAGREVILSVRYKHAF